LRTERSVEKQFTEAQNRLDKEYHRRIRGEDKIGAAELDQAEASLRNYPIEKEVLENTSTLTPNGQFN